MANIIEVAANFKDGVSANAKKMANNLQRTGVTAARALVAPTNAMGGFRIASGLAATSTAAAATAIVTALAAVSAASVKAAADVESLTLQFKFLLRDQEAAMARVKNLIEFAARTPFDLQEVQQASKILQTLTGGALATQEGLRLVGDVAATVGADLKNLSLHVGRLYSGLEEGRPIGRSILRLQQLGIISEQARSEMEKLQKQGKRTEAWEVIQKELKRSSGAMEELATTTKGLASTLRGEIYLAFAGAGAGLNNFLKGPLKGLIEFFKKMRENHTLELFSIGLRNLGEAFGSLVKGYINFYTAGTDVNSTVKLLATVFAGLTSAIKLGAEVVGTAFTAIGNIIKSVVMNIAKYFNKKTFLSAIIDPLKWAFDMVIVTADVALTNLKTIVFERLAEIAEGIGPWLRTIPKSVRIKLGLDYDKGEAEAAVEDFREGLTKRYMSLFNVNYSYDLPSAIQENIRKATEEFSKSIREYGPGAAIVGVAEAMKGNAIESLKIAKKLQADVLSLLTEGDLFNTFSKIAEEVQGIGGETWESVKASWEAFKAQIEEIKRTFTAPDQAGGAAEVVDEKLLALREEIKALKGRYQQIQGLIPAYTTLRDIALAAIDDQFAAARAAVTDETEANIEKVKKLYDDQLISFGEYQTALTNIQMVESRKRLEIDEREKEVTRTKNLEIANSIADVFKTTTDSIISTASLARGFRESQADEEYERDKKHIEENIRGERNRTRALAALDKKRESESKKFKKKELAADLAMSIANTALAVTNALNTQPFVPLGLIMAGIAGTTGAIQSGIIASQIAKLNSGGVVPGRGNKDTQPAMLTPGEAVFNRSQQNRLFALANGAANPAGAGGNITFNETIVVHGNLDQSAADRIKVDREKQLKELRNSLKELAFRGQLSGVRV